MTPEWLSVVTFVIESDEIGVAVGATVGFGHGDDPVDERPDTDGEPAKE